MSGRGQRFAALLGGLLLAGGGAGVWVAAERVREVGGARITDMVTTSGTVFAPAALPLGVLVLVVAGAGLALRGRLRRVSGLVELMLGVTSVTVVGLGIADASAAEGTLRSAPWLALAGAVLVIVAGASDLRGSAARPLLDQRYTVEGQAETDDEWSLAAEEEPGGDG